MKKELDSRIKNIINNEKYELLDTIVHDLYDIYLKTYLIGFEKYINNLKLDPKRKIIFYSNLLMYKDSKDKRIDSFIKGLIPLTLSKTISSNKIEFLNLLKEQKFRQGFAALFRKYGHFMNIDEDILSTILNLPEFLQDVLCNRRFKEKLEYYRFDFFKSLPQEYSNLIAFYTEHTNLYDNNLKTLYNMYFSKKLNSKQQEQLIEVQNELKNEYDIVESKKYYKLKPLSNLLRRINSDETYYEKLEYIEKNSKLSLIEVIKLLKKYDKTKIFKEICSDKFKYNNENIENLKFLASREKIRDINEIKSLNETSLENLKSMSRIHKSNVKVSITNGPQATTESEDNQIFSDGGFRQIRRINTDGTIIIKDAEGMSHTKAIKAAYKDMVFNENCKTVLERAKKAVEYLSTITFIIEGDACIMVSPKKITQEQFDSLKYLLEITNKTANINTIVYDVNKKEDTLIFDVDSIFDIISVKSIKKKKGNLMMNCTP